MRVPGVLRACKYTNSIPENCSPRKLALLAALCDPLTIKIYLLA